MRAGDLKPVYKHLWIELGGVGQGPQMPARKWWLREEREKQAIDPTEKRAFKLSVSGVTHGCKTGGWRVSWRCNRSS